MTRTYAQLQKEIEKLQAQADKLRSEEVGDVIARIRAAIDAYGLTRADLGFEARPPRKRGTGAPAKTAGPKRESARYRDEAGNEWAGRGARPAWLRNALAGGRRLEEFAV